MRGAERRSAHLWSAFRRGAPLAKGARLAALHRGSRQQLSPPLSSGPGFRGPGIGARLVQQAPCRAVLMPPDRGPGAARVRGYEPRPQAPHLLRLSERLRKTPLDEQGEPSMHIVLEAVKDCLPETFRRAKWLQAHGLFFPFGAALRWLFGDCCAVDGAINGAMPVQNRQGVRMALHRA